MHDRYGRRIDYLRISITDKCNLRCSYCMPVDIKSLPMDQILSFEEIAMVAEEAAGLGIEKIKLTGGEPLVRRDFYKLVSMLKKIPGIKSVTMTTNGVLLKDCLDRICDAGIDGINLSLDTLDEKRYAYLTGFDRLKQVKEGLYAALNLRVRVKINAVTPDWDETASDLSDVFRLIELSEKEPLDVRFIEMMPIGFGKGFKAISHDILIPAIKSRYENMTMDDSKKGNGPAIYYRIPGHRGRIGFISPIHEKFCQSCNRIRLTTRGYLKGCLCYDTGEDLKESIRSGLADGKKREAVRKQMENVILCKPASHCFSDEKNISEKHAMSAIGG